MAQNDNPRQRSDAGSADNDDRVRLPPGDYIDELADFVEWIANAKPEDEKTIRAEIKRYYFDVGDIFGGEALHRALSDILEPDLPKKARQEILNSIAVYATADPAEMGQLRALLAGGILSSAAGDISELLQTEEATSADVAAAGADVAATELPSGAWKYGWAKRGRYFEERLGRTLHPNFPIIDRFVNGIATSVKSIDLNAATYQNAVRLANRLNKYVDDVAAFNGAAWANDEVDSLAIKGRALSLAIPKGSVTAIQRSVINTARARAATLGVDFIVTAF